MFVAHHYIQNKNKKDPQHLSSDLKFIICLLKLIKSNFF